MVEMLLIFLIGSKIGKIAEEKGHSRIGYMLLTAVLWFAGEIPCALLGYALGRDFGPVMLGAVIGAAIGVAVSFAIVSRLPATDWQKTTFASAYQKPPLPASEQTVTSAADERTDEEKAEDDFAASVGLSALQSEDE